MLETQTGAIDLPVPNTNEPEFIDRALDGMLYAFGGGALLLIVVLVFANFGNFGFGLLATMLLGIVLAIFWASSNLDRRNN